MMNKDERYFALKNIKDQLLALTSSPLYEYRKANNYFPVIGEGNHFARIMFVGEAPGKNEAKTGHPFCGAAGKILNELLESAGISRADVYITNIVKDRPPENRDPEPEEINIYAPFLNQQINIIEPSIIAPLGRYSMAYIMENFGLKNQLAPISKLHGQIFKTNLDYGEVKIIPLYHPAVAIYRASMKDELKKDFQKLLN
jgi:DNA polymerase